MRGWAHGIICGRHHAHSVGGGGGGLVGGGQGSDGASLGQPGPRCPLAAFAGGGWGIPREGGPLGETGELVAWSCLPMGPAERWVTGQKCPLATLLWQPRPGEGGCQPLPQAPLGQGSEPCQGSRLPLGVSRWNLTEATCLTPPRGEGL